MSPKEFSMKIMTPKRQGAKKKTSGNHAAV